MEKCKCPVCHSSDCEFAQINGKIMFHVKCPICGEYNISVGAFRSDLSQYGKPHLLSGVIRNLYEKGVQLDLKDEDFEHLLDTVTIPSDPLESIDLLLKHFFARTTHVEKGVSFSSNTDYPLLYAANQKEFQFYINKARELNLIEPDDDDQDYRLTLKGWERIKELKQKEIDSNQAFVAMWFDENLDEAWEDGFKSALEETGFKPVRVDLEEHNEKICDRIIAEIRESGLLVADFTGQRGGVYFESGFALGLGITVIWTCRSDDADNLHFDTRQYNHIIWDDPEDLKYKLINRIKATVPTKS